MEEVRIVEEGRENTPMYELHVKIHNLIEDYTKEHGEISAMVILNDEKNKWGDGSLLGDTQELAREFIRIASMENTFFEVLQLILFKIRNAK